MLALERHVTANGFEKSAQHETDGLGVGDPCAVTDRHQGFGQFLGIGLVLDMLGP